MSSVLTCRPWGVGKVPFTSFTGALQQGGAAVGHGEGWERLQLAGSQLQGPFSSRVQTTYQKGHAGPHALLLRLLSGQDGIAWNLVQISPFNNERKGPLAPLHRVGH